MLPEANYCRGTKKLKYLVENIKALDVKLTTEEVVEIRLAITARSIHGERSAK